MLLTISPTHTLPPSHFLFPPCPFVTKTILLWHSYHLHVCDLWSLGATHDREHITFVCLRPLSSFNKIDSSCIHSPANWHSLTHFHGWIHSIVCIQERRFLARAFRIACFSQPQLCSAQRLSYSRMHSMRQAFLHYRVDSRITCDDLEKNLKRNSVRYSLRFKPWKCMFTCYLDVPIHNLVS